VGACLTSSVSESSDGLEVVVPADGSADGSLLPDGASVWSPVESSDNSGTSELAWPGASGESGNSSGVGSALLALSVELSNDLGTSEVESTPVVGSNDSPGASSEDSVGNSQKAAVSAVSDELSDHSWLVLPADSLLEGSLLPDGASLGAPSESFDNSGAAEGTGPSASGVLVVSELVDDASLALSLVSSDDLGLGEVEGAGSPWSSEASEDLLVASLQDLASSAVSYEGSHDLDL